jgi:hypothetical protein
MSIRKSVLSGITLVLIVVSAGTMKVVAEQPKDPQPASKQAKPAKVEADPLDLTDYCRIKASKFDKIKQFAWPAVPRGSQTFAGVPLEISGAVLLWGDRNAKNGQAYPEQIKDIPIHRKFETLYVCHAAFFEGKQGLPMCEIVFHYSDDTAASDKILCGDDAREWYANRKILPLGPSGPRSTLAWDGDAKLEDGPQAIRFCLTAIANPHPGKVVTGIDLVSPKTQTAACILGMTTGKSGLLKRPKEDSK